VFSVIPGRKILAFFEEFLERSPGRMVPLPKV